MWQHFRMGSRHTRKIIFQSCIASKTQQALCAEPSDERWYNKLRRTQEILIINYLSRHLYDGG
jgi:hypothetical protein